MHNLESATIDNVTYLVGQKNALLPNELEQDGWYQFRQIQHKPVPALLPLKRTVIKDGFLVEHNEFALDRLVKVGKQYDHPPIPRTGRLRWLPPKDPHLTDILLDFSSCDQRWSSDIKHYTLDTKSGTAYESTHNRGEHGRIAGYLITLAQSAEDNADYLSRLDLARISTSGKPNSID